MSTKQKRASGSIDPDYLYHPKELSPLSGLGVRQLVEMMDDGRIGYVKTGRVQGRRIRGSQYLAWLEAETVEPVA